MSASDALGKQFPRYTVVTAHIKPGAQRHTVKRVGFDTAEDAQEHMRSLDHTKDGSMLPNLPDSVIKSHEKAGLEYSSGHLLYGNRPAVTFLNKAMGPRYRDDS